MSPDAAAVGARRMVIAGVLVAVLAIVTAIVMSLGAQRRADGAVAGLARAPVGCDTTLEFAAAGDFVVFVETAGRLDQLDGGCEAPDTYERRAVRPPEVMVELTDDAGRTVRIRSTTAEGYDVDGFVGQPIGEVRIQAPGTHVVRVTSEEGDVAVAVGRDPADAGRPLTVAAGAVAAAGVLLGGVLAALGIVRSRRRPAPPPPPAWPPDFVPDSTIPLAPPAPPPPPGIVVVPPGGEQPGRAPGTSPDRPQTSPWAPPSTDGA